MNIKSIFISGKRIYNCFGGNMRFQYILYIKMENRKKTTKTILGTKINLYYMYI
jgi:hypothetical protein